MSRNVVLLVLDTVRKDIFDQRAEGIRELSDLSFEQAYAPSSWTVPSHASMFTGELPHKHEIHSHNINYEGLSTADTFLNTLDYRTIGVSANSFLSPGFGFGKSFDEFTNLHGNEELLPGGIDTASFTEQSGETGILRYLQYLKVAVEESALVPSLANALYMKLNNAALGRPLPRIGDYGARAVLQTGIDQACASDSFFLFANLVDAHAPHEVLRSYDTDVPSSWTSREHDIWEVNNRGVDQFSSYLDRFAELYGCAVEYLDQRVSSFVQEIQSKAEGETTVIVTADHGEELGLDHERTLGHKIPSAAVSQVPLEIINPPSAWDTGTVTDIVSLLDMGDIVRGIVKNENVNISRQVAPVERIGDSHPPGERTEFWDRAIRATYTVDEAYEWDTKGDKNRYENSKSTRYLVEENTKIPESHQDLFANSLIQAKSEAKAHDTDLEEVDNRTQERLEDLGYM